MEHERDRETNFRTDGSFNLTRRRLIANTLASIVGKRSIPALPSRGRGKMSASRDRAVRVITRHTAS
jgi:hypothetical protein